MKNYLRHLMIPVIGIVLILGMTGCSEPQERYEDPPWLGGSSIETLELRGNYKIFLRLMEKANYRDAITKQLFTLFVPNDEAFTKYFQEAGINSVEDLNEADARQLFTLHVLRNPRSRFQLIYEYMWAELQGPDGEYASLFYRKPVESANLYSETVRYEDELKGQTVLIHTDKKYVPLFSTDYFEDFFGALDGSDYLFMYPNSEWGNNLQWHNAMVTESEVKTSSGFIYFVDQVVPPMPSIEEYMLNNPDKYGTYYDILQRFASYSKSSYKDDANRVVYKKGYRLISNVAEEQGPSPGNETRQLYMFTAFLPPNDVLDEYLDRTVLAYYPSLDSVPEVTLYYILQTHVSRGIGLLSKMSKSYFNAFGDPMLVNKSDIRSSFMSSNGIIYEMNKVLESNVFRCVPRHLFFNKNYSTFLYAMNQAAQIASMSNPVVDVTLFAPSNDALLANNIRYNEDNSKVEIAGSDGVWKTMRADDLTMFVQDHIYTGILTPDLIDGDGGYIEMNSGNYAFYKDGQVFAAKNQLMNNPAVVDEDTINAINGILYKVSQPVLSYYLMGDFIKDDPELSSFAALLEKVKFLAGKTDVTTKDSIQVVSFLTQSKYWTAFIPTNDAIAQAEAEGLIPADVDSLKNFISYHFIRKDVIFDDGVKSGMFTTNGTHIDPLDGTTVFSEIKVESTPGSLVITDNTGNAVTVEPADANFLVRKGVVHKINSVLKY